MPKFPANELSINHVCGEIEDGEKLIQSVIATVVRQIVTLRIIDGPRQWMAITFPTNVGDGFLCVGIPI